MTRCGQGAVRIGLVVGQLTQGGAERQLYELARRLPDYGYEPSVFCLSEADRPYGPMLREAGITVCCLPRRRRFELRRTSLLAKAMKRRRINLAHSFLFVGNIYCHLALRRSGVKLFLPSVRNFEDTRTLLFRILDQRVFSRAQLILVNSPSLGERLAGAYKIREDQLRVVPNGLDLERFQPVNQPAETKPGHKIIGSVSLFKKAKRIPMILEMASRLCLLRSDTIFRLVGGGPDLPAMLALRDRMGLKEKVQMPGESGSVPSELSRFDIFLLASEGEGMPNAVLEAMAASLPVVASRVTGTKDVVVDGRSGVLFEPDDVGDAVEALQLLLDDQKMRRKMGEEGARLAAQKYSADAMVKATVRIYEELMESAP